MTTTRAPSKKRLVALLDEAWSKLVRTVGLCERCGRRPPEVVLQGAHIVGRTNRRTRWEPANGVALCVACHLYWAHVQPLAFADFVRGLRPDCVAAVEAIQNEIAKWTLDDYATILAALRGRLEQVEQADGAGLHYVLDRSYIVGPRT